MKYRISLTPKARREFDRDKDWDEAREAGLGDLFAAKIQEALDRIAANPRKHAIVTGAIRKAVVSVFPYCIYYFEDDDRVRVISVFHTKRNPQQWMSRIVKP